MSRSRDIANIGDDVASGTVLTSSGAIDVNASAPADSVAIDSSGNVGIGTTSPAGQLHLNKTSDLVLRNDYGISWNTNNSSPKIYASSGSNLEFKHGSGSLGMRMDASGNLGVGTTSMNGKLNCEQTGTSGQSLHVKVNNASYGSEAMHIYVQGQTNEGSYEHLRCFSHGGARRLSIQANGNVINSNSSYGGISDVNLKENIYDATSQWNDVKAMRVVNYSLIEEESDTATKLGVIAQELEASGMGGLVNIDKDGIRNVKYSVLYMKAVKALQEAMDRIETLEARVDALENA